MTKTETKTTKRTAPKQSGTNLKLGQTVVTAGVAHMLEQKFLVPEAIIGPMIDRHRTGDWGELDSEDWAMNDKAVETGQDRVLSAYLLADDTKVWIITEWDRSVTTILLPEEY